LQFSIRLSYTRGKS